MESDDKNRIAELEKALAAVSKDVGILYSVMSQAWDGGKLRNSWWDGEPKKLGALDKRGGAGPVWGGVTSALKDKIKVDIKKVLS